MPPTTRSRTNHKPPAFISTKTNSTPKAQTKRKAPSQSSDDSDSSYSSSTSSVSHSPSPIPPSGPSLHHPTSQNQTSLFPPLPPTLPTPSLADSHTHYKSYFSTHTERLVLTHEPYKSVILPYWRFRTPAIARDSAEQLWELFARYLQLGDFVGADMVRKFIQMGMTRSKRYANHKGGRKYAPHQAGGGGEVDIRGEELAKWEPATEKERKARAEKLEASEIFKGYWRRCLEDERYKGLRETWVRGKKEWEREQKQKL